VLGLRFDRSYAGGEIGAERWLDESGRAFVLKRGRSAARAAAVTGRLRELGYPAPRYVRVEEEWALQEELPGEPLEPWLPLDEPIAARLLELHALHSEARGPEPGGSWRRVVASSVLSGARSYMRLATLRDHSERSRELLARCQEAVRRFGDRIRQIGWGRIGLADGGETKWLDLHSVVDGEVAALRDQLAGEDDPARWLAIAGGYTAEFV